MSNHTLNFLFLSFFLVLTSQSFAQEGVSVSSGKLFFSDFPGQSQTQQLIITNPNDQPILLQTYYKDWKRDSQGVKQYFEVNTLPNSCTNWININPTTISVPANGKTNINVTMTIPNTYEPNQGVKNTMLFLKQIKDPVADNKNSNGVNSSIQLVFQIGVHLYYSHPALSNKNLEINDLYVNDKNRVINLELKNSGETLLEAFVQFELTNMETGAEIQLFERSLGVNFMPADVRRFKFPIPATLPSGQYSLTSIIDIGSDKDLLLGVLDIKI